MVVRSADLFSRFLDLKNVYGGAGRHVYVEDGRRRGCGRWDVDLSATAAAAATVDHCIRRRR